MYLSPQTLATFCLLLLTIQAINCGQNYPSALENALYIRNSRSKVERSAPSIQKLSKSARIILLPGNPYVGPGVFGGGYGPGYGGFGGFGGYGNACGCCQRVMIRRRQCCG